MRKLTLFVALAMMIGLSGCAAVTYSAPDGTKVEYVRFLTGSDKIVGSIGEAAISVSGQEINVELLKALISAAK